MEMETGDETWPSHKNNLQKRSMYVKSDGMCLQNRGQPEKMLGSLFAVQWVQRARASRSKLFDANGGGGDRGERCLSIRY